MCAIIVFVLFVYFAIKLEGTALRWGTCEDNLRVFFGGPSVRCLEEYIWRNELSLLSIS